MLSSYKAIFFDAGGTLFHPFPSVGRIYRETASRYGCQTAAEELEKKFVAGWLRRDGLSSLAGHSSEKIEKEWWRGLVREIFSGPASVREFETFFEELYETFGHPNAWRLYPGVIEVLEELKKRGKRLAVISNWDSRLFKLCEGLGVLPYFDFILASAVFGASKPGRKIFEEALSRTGVSAKDAVHIGDSYEDDVRGALGAGIEAILVNRHPEADRPPHPKTIRDLRELIS